MTLFSGCGLSKFVLQSGLALKPNIQPLPPGGFLKVEGLDPSSPSFRLHWSQLLHWLHKMTCSRVSVWPQPSLCATSTWSDTTACILTSAPSASLCLDTLVAWGSLLRSGNSEENPDMWDYAALIRAKYVSASLELHYGKRNFNGSSDYWTGTFSIAALYAILQDPGMEGGMTCIYGGTVPSWCRKSDTPKSLESSANAGLLLEVDNDSNSRICGESNDWEHNAYVATVLSGRRLRGCYWQTVTVTQALRSQTGSMALVVHIVGLLAAEESNCTYCVKMGFPLGLRPVMHAIQLGGVSQVRAKDKVLMVATEHFRGTEKIHVTHVQRSNC